MAALLVPVGGCATPGAAQQEQSGAVDLTARPHLDQVVADYEQMQQRIRERLDTELGPFAWKQTEPAARSLCGSDAPGANRMYLARWGFDGAIPDQDWPRAHDIVTTIVAEYGFTAPAMAIDTPGHHRTTAVDDALGAFFDFRTQVNTLMEVATGCHPPS